ncbi:MAG: hypothetical protein LBH80_04020 [Prevotellaceae bacterium]|jgi:hypothetical protein|nr:hypothetical protein [Prevotellaceae bacterium]
MKKLILITTLFCSMTATTIAQTTEKAIGLRLGYSAEVSFLYSINSSHRIEADLGVVPIGAYNGFFLNGVYQWTWDLSDYLTKGFGWYVGVGGGIGGFHKSFGLTLAGQIGLEYNFDFPLQLTLDYRPGFSLVPDILPTLTGFAVSARYRF